MKPKVLVFCEHYRPGYKGGGAMWNVVNLVDRLSDRFEFAVVTRNHDGAADTRAYTEVDTGSWNDRFGHPVYYAEPSTFTSRLAAELVKKTRPDAIYLNSVFGLMARKLLNARKNRQVEDIPIMVAPCGELFDRSLAVKPLKKTAFLTLAKLQRLFRGVTWKSTSEAEAVQVRRRFGANARIAIAADLVPESILPDLDLADKPVKVPGAIKLIVVARFTPMKNIHFLLERLSETRGGEYEVEMIGNAKGEEYWERCEPLLSSMPAHVKVNIRGALEYAGVLRRLVDSHVFVLPSLSENFGYVFVEAMSAGCPLLISENTIWSGVDEAEAGWVRRLDEPTTWVETLERLAAMDQVEYQEYSARAREYGTDWLRTSGDAEANIRAIETALNNGTSE